MAVNRTSRGHIVYGGTQDEKPVINEQFEAFVPAGKIPLKKFSTGKAPLETADSRPADFRPGEDGQEQQAGPLQKGIRQFRMKHWEKALQEFLLVPPDTVSDEEKTELAYYLGLCHSKLERYDDAALHLEQVISAGGDKMRSYQCRMILAYIYIKTGRVKMAEFELGNIEAGGIETAQLYNTMAYAAYIQKHYLRAIELYEKVLDLDTDNTTALNSLGFILADQGLDTSKGLRLCRKAVGKNPESAAYLDSLGWASFKCGRRVEANKWLRKARLIAPNEPEILDHLKMVGREAL